MSIQHFLSRLKAKKIRLHLEGNELRASAPNGMLTPELVGELRDNKAELIAFLKKLDAGKYAAIPAAGIQEHYPLSPAQNRLWILEQYAKEGSAAYNVPVCYRLHGKLDIEAFKKALNAIVERHESLRTVFREVAGEPRQFILHFESVHFNPTYADCRNEADPEQAAYQRAAVEMGGRFYLDKGPLLRVYLARTADNAWLFLMTIHHIISDEWSMGILINEILILYNACHNGVEHVFSPLTIQYRDFAAWQAQQLTANNMDDHRKYWLEKFNGDIPVLNLPSDRPRPAIQSFSGSQVISLIPKEQLDGLKELCRQSGEEPRASRSGDLPGAPVGRWGVVPLTSSPE